MANALARSRRILEPILQWTKQDLLEDRLDDLRELVTQTYGDEKVGILSEAIEELPPATTIEEALAFLSQESAGRKADVLAAIYARLERDAPEDGLHLAPFGS